MNFNLFALLTANYGFIIIYAKFCNTGNNDSIIISRKTLVEILSNDMK